MQKILLTDYERERNGERGGEKPRPAAPPIRAFAVTPTGAPARDQTRNPGHRDSAPAN